MTESVLQTPVARPLHSVALASQSPRRRELLESLGLEVVRIASGYDEAGAHTIARRRGDASALALAHAIGKADLAEAGGPPLLVAADTIVAIDGISLGKPRDSADARDMLRRLSGREHIVHTGFAAVDRLDGARVTGVESTRVTFLPLDDADIERYVATGEPMDKAGAYGIQGRGALLVASIDGDFYTVMGLPLARLGRAFSHLGYVLR